jgi:hypothetical protein
LVSCILSQGRVEALPLNLLSSTGPVSQTVEGKTSPELRVVEFSEIRVRGTDLALGSRLPQRTCHPWFGAECS